MLTATFEQLVNRGLPRSPRARALCAALTAKTLAIEISAGPRLLVTSNGSTLEVRRAKSDDPVVADATLAGGPFGLLALLRKEGEAQSRLQSGSVTLTGDTHIAQQFAELMRLLRPDPEEELSLVIGDVAAHQLGRLARGARAFGERATDTGLNNLAEFLGHERADLVPRHEGEQFLRGVDAVREGVDRAQARIELLARRRSAS